MYIRQFYTPALQQASYYLESNGEAAVIDPLRDAATYLQFAQERGASIRYIFETHYHSDFVSGHPELARATGAPVVFGPGGLSGHIAQPGERFLLGALTVEALHTPGHTPESLCLLLRDENDNPCCLFSGDTLLTDDAGRPDPAQCDEQGAAALAAQLYGSMQQLLALPDRVIVYPAHGRPCESEAELRSTVGSVRTSAPALQQEGTEEFIRFVLKNNPPVPGYFQRNAARNKTGSSILAGVLEQGLIPLDVSAFKAALAGEGSLVLDTRPQEQAADGMIPGSAWIGLEDRFARWAGLLLPPGSRLLLVCEPGREADVLLQLARVGIEEAVGYLAGGYASWKEAGEPCDLYITVEADELAMDLPHDDYLIVVDVRSEAEYASGHVKDAVHLPLSEINDPALLANIDERDNLYLHCSDGYRSAIACSLLKRQGFHNLRLVDGGWGRIREEKIETVQEKAALN
ncbi:MAG TPA: MBL fold metallo-hydrolase [Lacibacter sp.]|nr:MBL fold metallo-hydrolase [Lacibacter sp.]HMO88124.1 MBL fold metallo-hydrolase [Lacibacter sp.]